jgi:hypothetical protein
LLTHFLRFVTMVAEMEKWKRDHEPGNAEQQELVEETGSSGSPGTAD